MKRVLVTILHCVLWFAVGFAGSIIGGWYGYDLGARDGFARGTKEVAGRRAMDMHATIKILRQLVNEAVDKADRETEDQLH